MTRSELNQLRDLAQAATPGPWRVEAQGHAEQEVARVNNLEVAPPDSVELAHCATDAAYIAAVSPDVVLGLIDEVDKLRAASRAVTQCRCTLVQQSVGDGCEVCNPKLAQRLADEAQAEVVEVLRELVDALDGAFISSWQSTAAWQTQLDRARAALATRGGGNAE